MEGLHKCNQDCCRFSFNCGKVVPNSMMQKRCSFFYLRHVHRLQLTIKRWICHAMPPGRSTRAACRSLRYIDGCRPLLGRKGSRWEANPAGKLGRELGKGIDPVPIAASRPAIARPCHKGRRPFGGNDFTPATFRRSRPLQCWSGSKGDPGQSTKLIPSTF